MSVSNTHYKCTGCSLEAFAMHNPITLIYQLPDGSELVTGRRFGWCRTCNTIKNIEPDFLQYFDTEEQIKELTAKTAGIGFKVSRMFDRVLGGGQQETELKDLHELICGLKIARARNSSPRCLTCGGDLASGVTPLSEFVHDCGGTLVEIPNEDAPRFSYKPKSIFLDYEGNVVDKFTPGDAYINLAKHLSLEGVVEQGRFVGVLAQVLFDKEDLAPMLADKSVFGRFARVIETRLMEGDFENPLAGFTEGPSSSQMATLKDAPRVLLTRTQQPVSKWLRSQVTE